MITEEQKLSSLQDWKLFVVEECHLDHVPQTGGSFNVQFLANRTDGRAYATT